MLRSWARLRRGLPCFMTPRSGAQASVTPTGVLRHCSRKLQENSLAWFSPSEKNKDWAVPNASWSQEMIRQFNRYIEMAKGGSWLKLPSYQSLHDYLPEGRQQQELQKRSRLFLRCIDEEGMGFEYVMFLNPLEKRMVCVLQLGPYLEGPSGFVHGGSIATIIDSTLGGCAFSVSRKVLTANLNINYKTPITLGSVVLVEGKLEKIEGRKIFVCGEVRSPDGQTLHAEATALFIQPQPSLSPQEETEFK